MGWMGWNRSEDEMADYEAQACDSRQTCDACGDAWTEDHDCPADWQARLEKILGYDADTEIWLMTGSDSVEVSFDALKTIVARLEKGGAS